MDRSPFDVLFRSMDDSIESIFGAGPASGGLGGAYQIHQDDNQVQVDVDLPGVAARDLNVEVLHSPTCVIQWSGERTSRLSKNSSQPKDSAPEMRQHFSNRLRLGSWVDCDRLAANLSRGVLQLTVPKKAEGERESVRSVQITQLD